MVITYVIIHSIKIRILHKNKNVEYTVFGYKKGLKIQINIILKYLCWHYLSILTLCIVTNRKFCVKSRLLSFISQNIEKSQNTVFGYKKWSNFEFDNIFWQTIHKKCILYHFSIILWTYFFMVRSHGFDGLFGAFDLRVACQI